MTGHNYSTLDLLHEEIAKKNACSYKCEKGIVIDFLRSAFKGRGSVLRGGLTPYSEDGPVVQLCRVPRTVVIHVTANRNPSAPIRNNRARYQPTSFAEVDVP